ncbi:MAG: glycine/sarcosine/betaine reductase selenoprotein B family protein [Chloroflexi bacterium]|nr:glycine/sarcosine/betaine reductase selenoprotein B family protein [Chloroflexota bacterium]
MTKKLTLWERLSQQFFAVPAVAQLWAKRTAQQTNQLVALVDGIPFARLRKPLAQCRVALLTTAGVHLHNQTPYNMENPDGDPTYREIPTDVALDQITITHKYYDHTDADVDLNVVFPLLHFRDLVEKQVIGSLAPRHFGFMGHIDQALINVLNQQTAPEVAAKLRADQVDFAFLTPA